MKRAFVVVVTHDPEAGRLAAALDAVSPQAESVIVVDDASRADLVEWLRNETSRRSIEFLQSRENRGLAYGQNIGIARAIDRGARYVVLLDQDSVPSAGMVGRLVRELETRIDPPGRAAAAGASRVERIHEASYTESAAMALDEAVQTPFLISSGCCFSVDALRKVGLMDEALFIEHVDTDWCFRARSQGYSLYRVPSATMAHEFGHRSWKLGGKIVRSMRPVRYYYLFRNSLALHRRKHVPRSWVRYDWWRLAALFLVHTLITPPRLANLRMIIRGIADGLAGKMGRYEGRA